MPRRARALAPPPTRASATGVPPRARRPRRALAPPPTRRGLAVRRPAPRPLRSALEHVLLDARPAGLLAEVQSAWPGVAGKVLAGAATPVSERDGTVTLACESSVWAQELELLGADLAGRLNGVLHGGRVERLRFVVGSGANRR